MRVFFDAEFLEDGRTIDLISLGAVREDGMGFYAISSEFDLRKAKAHPFVSKHVLPTLHSADLWQPRKQIATDFLEFCGNGPEFWADFGSYDWVALCQLYGTMMDLPAGWPMFVRDIQQYKYQVPIPFQFPDFGIGFEHNAKYDARVCAARYHYITEMIRKYEG